MRRISQFHQDLFPDDHKLPISVPHQPEKVLHRSALPHHVSLSFYLGSLNKEKCIDHPQLLIRSQSHCPSSTRTGGGLLKYSVNLKINIEFRMTEFRIPAIREAFHSVPAAIHQGDFLTFRELKDVCLHILIVQSIRSSSSLQLGIFIPIIRPFPRVLLLFHLY